MEPRRDTIQSAKARRVSAARLLLICAWAVCGLILILEAAEYALSFRRQSLEVTARNDASPLIVEAAEHRMDINQASAAHLTAVPGIGPEIADRVIALRKKRGGFRFLEELMDVSGIGEKRFAVLKEYFYCAPPRP